MMTSARSIPARILYWLPNFVSAAILAQTLFFKFTASPESVYIFSQLGMEPAGRIGSGVAELIAAILLLIPSKQWVGAGLALGVMAGAILSHLGPLGVEVQGDGGLLFGLAITVAIMAAIVLFRERVQLMTALNTLQGKKQ